MRRANRLARGAVLGLSLLGLSALWPMAAGQEAKKGTAPANLDPEHAAKMAKGLEVFKQHVKPILVDRCLRCHGGKAVESDLDMSDREALLKGGQHGPVVVPGKGQDSLLIKLVAHQREPKMPK